jgi:ABC-type lipoprotein release transport system permease subunit
LSSLLYATSPADPTIYLLTALNILLIAVIAISFPANRAVRIDPSMALRNQ